MASSPNPPTPPYTDSLEWITAYMTIHMLSPDSFRYAYYLWYIIAAFFALFSIIRFSPFNATYLGAHWNKWSRRRRTWRRKLHLFPKKSTSTSTYPVSLPSNGQILTLVLLFFITICLCFIGPDLIRSTPPPPSTLSRRGYDIAPYYVFQPTYTIPKAWWTSGGRTGLYAFALFPLCVLFILKSPPFAVFAMPFTARFFYDKLAYLHQWTARLIWFITAIHVILWSVQLAKDKRTGANTTAYRHAWEYAKFIYGWAAFGLLSLLILTSSRLVRRHYYEIFYFLHILLVPATLIMSALHHPPIWYWCWAALGLWVGERLWRAVWWLYMNGVLTPGPDPDAAGMGVEKRHSSHSYCPPPGYARCELLTGAAVRLTFVPPGFVSWYPGQSFLIAIPSVSKFTSHPFTCASICDEQDPSESGHAMVFCIRTKSGWTNDLWDHVTELLSRELKHDPNEAPPYVDDVPADSVILKMWAEGPHGSAASTDWKSHSTVVIIAGGVGVTYGASVLEYLCRCMAGRDGKYLGGQSGAAGQKGFLTQRVRFVWLLREFAHIQWCASTLRTCLNLVPGHSLQIDIFITNPLIPRPQSAPPPPSPVSDPDINAIHLEPPTPHFVYEDISRSRRGSVDSVIDLSYYSESGEEESGSGDHTLDLTNFDGDREVSLYGEDIINYRVSKIGRQRRESTRSGMMVRDSAAPPGDSPGHTLSPSADGLTRFPHPLSRSQHSAQSTEEPKAGPSTERSPTPIQPTSDLSRNGSKQSDFTMIDLERESMTHELPSGKSWYHPPFLTIVPPTRSLTPPLTSPVPSLTSSWDSGSSASQAIIATATSGAQVRIELSRKELQDVSVVSEYARPGKPKLDAILEDEVKQSQGRILVACCGPSSLDAKVRKAVSSQIVPGRVYIDLVSEDFSF